MKKAIRIAGLVVFWVSTFALVTTLLRWKQELNVMGTELAEAGLAGTMNSGQDARPSGSNFPDASAPAGSAEAAVKVGRSLFDLPAPYNARDVSDLMNDLESVSGELRKRKAALDLKEQELTILEQELETRRLDLLQMARGMRASLPEEADGMDSAALVPPDPESYRKIAAILAGMKDKEQAKRALLAKEPKEAAQLLLMMKEKDAASILALFPEEALQRITAAMIRLESTNR